LTLRDVCDIAWVLMVERVERIVVGDRQELLSAAAANGAENYTPLDVEAALSAFHDHIHSEPGSVADPLIQRIREQVAA